MKTPRFRVRGSGCVLLLAAAWPAIAQETFPTASPVQSASAWMQRLAPVLAPVDGGPARFVARGAAVSSHYTPDGVGLARVSATRPGEPIEGWGVHWAIVGARAVAPTPTGTVPGRVNTFIGRDRAKWRVGLPSHSGLEYRGVMPGVNLRVEPIAGGFQYSLHAAPGADLRRVTLRYDGVQSLRVVEGGRALELDTGLGMIREVGLRAYQPVPGGERPVRARYGTVRHVGELTWEYGITLDGVDPALPVIIDPAIAWSSFLGGSSSDFAYDVAVDGAGNTFVVGNTHSSNFPTVGALDPTHDGLDVFVAKVNASGSALVWSTFFGGSSSEFGVAIALDQDGNPCLAGSTMSIDFPVNGFQDRLRGSWDTYVAKLDTSGTDFLWGTYLGGTADEFGWDLAVDGAGQAYLTGQTTSVDFPSMGGFDGVLDGSNDAFAAKLGADGASLLWSSFLGGAGADVGNGLALDSQRNVYVVGNTGSPTMAAGAGFDATLSGAYDGFVAKVAASGAQLEWATHLGGSAADSVKRVVVAPGGDLVVVGDTSSGDFPSSNGFDSSPGGMRDAFVTRIAAAGNGIVWSSFLGGSDDDSVSAMAIDPSGAIYVVGDTASQDFPLAQAFDSVLGGTTDAFLSKIEADGTGLGWSTFLGGSSFDEGAGVAATGGGVVYAVGRSGSTDFPLVPGFDGTFGGGAGDGFIVKTKVPDPTAPVAGSVFDGAEAGIDLDVQSSRTSVSATWTGFSDSESGIAEYEWAIGTTPGGIEVLDFTPLGQATSASRGSLALRRGETLYVTVRARNGDGATATAISDGVEILGGACNSAADCRSGFCVDGVCCDTACADGCRSCSQFGATGTCSPVPDQTGCSDGIFCNGSELCAAGKCSSGEPVTCEEGWVCSESARGCQPSGAGATQPKTGCGCHGGGGGPALSLLLALALGRRRSLRIRSS